MGLLSRRSDLPKAKTYPDEADDAEQMEAMMTPIRSMPASQGFQFTIAYLALGASFALLTMVVFGLL